MPVAGRIKKYYMFTFILGTTAFLFYLSKAAKDESTCIKNPTSIVLESLPRNDVLAELLVVYLFLAILSTVFALKKLFRSGFNNEGRSFFFKKQFAYVLAFSVMWQIQILNTYFVMFN
jgi:hypothetical protein